MARKWHIWIPVRPKAVQSVRGGSRGFYADPRVTAWKKQIIPYIQKCCDGPPSSMLMRITLMRFLFQYPKSMPERIKQYIRDGGIVPYVGCADLADNLAKGLIDCCAGIVFENDRQIWQQTGTREKVYGEHDGIVLDFEETPGVVTADGSLASGFVPGRSGLL